MSNLNRRKFLHSALVGSGAILCFQGLSERSKLFKTQTISALENKTSLYGALNPKSSANTGETFLSLPQGFQYNVFSKSGSPMTNGQPTPRAHDGMGIFDIGSNWALIRNHEIFAFAGSGGTVSGTTPYDSQAGGGTTTLLIDKTSRLPINQFVSLSGTSTNCAGGTTPWNTWISCEETTAGTVAGYARPHGYCFEVSPSNQRPAEPSSTPIALTQLGRFRHEAIAVDRRGGIVYLTEDNTPAGFYRFVPDNYGKLAAGGKLQMLAVKNQPNFDARTGQTVGTRYLVNWVNIPEPDPANAESDSLAVFKQGHAQGAAVFSRLEGCFAENFRIYFTSTDGGNQGLGQVWEYRHRKLNSGILKLVFESPNASVLNKPDNICFGQRGNLFICEDNLSEIFLRVLSPDGMMSNFAKNVVPGFQDQEFAGSIFSSDKQTLFVNIQSPGLTFAIWGNW